MPTAANLLILSSLTCVARLDGRLGGGLVLFLLRSDSVGFVDRRVQVGRTAPACCLVGCPCVVHLPRAGGTVQKRLRRQRRVQPAVCRASTADLYVCPWALGSSPPVPVPRQCREQESSILAHAARNRHTHLVIMCVTVWHTAAMSACRTGHALTPLLCPALPRSPACCPAW